MKRKEAIIRYLGHVGWASRHHIAEHIKASPELTSVKLSELKRVGIVRNVEWANGIKVWVELKRVGIVRNVEWANGIKVWVLTKEGGERFQYYARRDRERAD